MQAVLYHPLLVHFFLIFRSSKQKRLTIVGTNSLHELPSLRRWRFGREWAREVPQREWGEVVGAPEQNR